MNEILHVYCDGASRGNPGEASIGVYATTSSAPPGRVLARDSDPDRVFAMSELIGRATNNEAEYRALIAALKKLRTLNTSSYREILLLMDSQLVVEQVAGRYRVKTPHLLPLFNEVRSLMDGLRLSLRHIPRTSNEAADYMANLALDNAGSHVS